MVKVEYQPEGDLSPWLQRTSPMVGNGWGIHAPMPIGTQVLIAPVEGDHDAGVIIGSIYSNKALPPGAADGEVILQSETGAIIHLLAGGKALFQDAAGSSLLASNDGNATLTVPNTFFVKCESFNVQASVGVTIQAPLTNISEEVDIGTGPLKVNGETVIVP
jgi:phage baseplate assembly protein V